MKNVNINENDKCVRVEINKYDMEILKESEKEIKNGEYMKFEDAIKIIKGE